MRPAGRSPGGCRPRPARRRSRSRGARLASPRSPSVSPPRGADPRARSCEMELSQGDAERLGDGRVGLLREGGSGSPALPRRSGVRSISGAASRRTAGSWRTQPKLARWRERAARRTRLLTLGLRKAFPVALPRSRGRECAAGTRCRLRRPRPRRARPLGPTRRRRSARASRAGSAELVSQPASSSMASITRLRLELPSPRDGRVEAPRRLRRSPRPSASSGSARRRTADGEPAEPPYAEGSIKGSYLLERRSEWVRVAGPRVSGSRVLLAGKSAAAHRRAGFRWAGHSSREPGIPQLSPGRRRQWGADIDPPPTDPPLGPRTTGVNVGSVQFPQTHG